MASLHLQLYELDNILALLRSGQVASLNRLGDGSRVREAVVTMLIKQHAAYIRCSCEAGPGSVTGESSGNKNGPLDHNQSQTLRSNTVNMAHLGAYGYSEPSKATWRVLSSMAVTMTTAIVGSMAVLIFSSKKVDV